MNLPEMHNLPPELILDPNHPANDQYIKDARNIQRLIVAETKKMSYRAVQATKMKHKGIPNTEIAKRLKVTPTTISRLTCQASAVRLASLLGYYAAHTDGPQLAQRTAMLWRIARANEETDPKTAISALSEINKVDKAFQDLQTGNNQKAPIVVVNQQILPKTALDGIQGS